MHQHYFGQLREYLQNASTPTTEIQTLLEAVYTQDRTRYNDRWKPYIAGFPHLKFETKTMEDLAMLKRLLPPVTTITIWPNALIWKAMQAPEHAATLKRVNVISARGPIPLQALMFLMKQREMDCHTLDLQRCALTPKHTHCLAEGRGLTRLHTLNLHANQLGSAGIEALCGATQSEEVLMGRIQHLNVRQNKLGAKDIRRLLNATTLRSLDVSWNAIGTQGCMYIARSKTLANLHTLNLQANALNVRSIVNLGSHHMTRVQHLELGNNQLDDEAMAALGDFANLDKIRTLNIRVNAITSTGAQYLAQHSGLRALKTLNLSTNMLKDKGAIAIATSPYLRQLTTLNLNHNQISADAMDTLVEALPPTLQHLNLWDNPIGDRGAIALAHAPALSNLRTLKISKHAMGHRGYTALANSPYLPEAIRVVWRRT